MNPKKQKGERGGERREVADGQGGGRGGGRGGLAEFGLPLAEQLVELFLEDGGIGGTALLVGRLDVREHPLEVIHPVLGLLPQRPPPVVVMQDRAADAAAPLPHPFRPVEVANSSGRDRRKRGFFFSGEI